MIRTASHLLLSAVALLPAGLAAGDAAPLPEGWDANWPAFRGPYQTAITTQKDLPATWSESKNQNIAWKVAVPLEGMSSPVVWNDRVYLSGGTKEKRGAFCFAADTGKLLWKTELPEDPKVDLEYAVYNMTGMHAVPTPVVDGKYLHALYASGQVAAFDVQTGKLAWTVYLGKPDNMWGLSNSLLRYQGNVLVQFVDLIALDAATGEKRWSKPATEGGWSSPILAKVGTGHQVILMGSPGLGGYDPATGAAVWHADGLWSGDVAPTPIFASGLAIGTFEGAGLFGVTTDGKGALPKEATKLSITELKTEGLKFPNSVSPVSDGERVYVFTESLICVDIKTSKVLYEEVLKTASDQPDQTTYASPTIIDGRLYAFGSGATHVIKTGPTFVRLGHCDLADSFNTSPAFAPGRIFIRSDSNLYCISAVKPK